MQSLLIVLLPILIFIPDLVRSGNHVFTVTTFHSEFLSFTALCIFLALRIIRRKPIIKAADSGKLLVIAIVLTAFAAFGVIITDRTSPNFIYSITQLRLEILCYMAAAAMGIWIMQKNNVFFKKHLKRILFFAPLIFLGYCTLMFFLPYEIFNNVVKEDSLLEYLQFFTLLVGAISAFCVAGLKSIKGTMYKLVFIAVGFLLLFVAGDEISWGQRIFDVNTPERFKSINAQGEITLHNINEVHGLAPIGYAVIGFWGSIASIVVRSVSFFSATFRRLLVPGREFFFFFFFPFVFNFYTYTNDHFVGRFTEPIELVLYSGITLFLVTILVNKKSTL